jgi:hypothetical protein
MCNCNNKPWFIQKYKEQGVSSLSIIELDSVIDWYEGSAHVFSDIPSNHKDNELELRKLYPFRKDKLNAKSM